MSEAHDRCGTRCVSESFVIDGFGTVERGEVTSAVGENERGEHAVGLTMVVEGRQVGVALTPEAARSLAIYLIEHAAWIDAQDQ